MILLDQLLPSVAGELPDRVRELVLDLSNRKDVVLLSRVIDDVQTGAAGLSETKLLNVATAIHEDLLAARAQQNIRAIDLLRLDNALLPLKIAISMRRLQEAWEWAVRPVTLDDPRELRVDTELGPVLLAAASYGPDGIMLLVQWAGCVWYLAWSAGYHQDLARELSPAVSPYLGAMVGSGEFWALDTAAHFVSYELRRGATPSPDLISALEAALVDDRVDDLAKVQLAILLSGAAAHLTPTDRRERAATALATFGATTLPQHRLQLLSAVYGGDPGALEDNLGQVLEEIDRYNETTARSATPLEGLFARGRMFDLIAPLLYTFLDNGMCDAATTLLARWQGVAPSERRTSPSAIAMRRATGVLWATEGRRVVRDDVVAEGALTTALNDALGLALVDREVPDFDLRMPERPGHPNSGRGPDFRAVLNAAVQPALGATLIREAEPEPTAIVNLVAAQVPLSRMCLDEGGSAPAINISFQEPLPDRALVRAELWFGSIAGAEVEVRIVGEILGSCGVAVRCVSADSATRQDFLDAYRSPDLDLLWVSSHAEFGHWAPDATELILSNQTRVGISDLLGVSMAAAERRRLLVLNVCDGAVTAGLGGPSQVGLGGVCAGRAQAVVSHLWPAHWKDAATFGVLFAAELMTQPAFRKAYEAAIRIMSRGPDAAVDALGRVPAASALLDRLGSDADASSFIRTASACFLE